MINYFSNSFIPIIIVTIIIYGLYKEEDVIATFVKGSKDGLNVISNIFPTMLAMCCAVGMFRNSGSLELIGSAIEPFMQLIKIPKEIGTLVITRPISYAASVGLFLDILKNYGPDSYQGMYASLLMSCSETLIYTLGMYMSSVNLKKTRYMLPVGILINVVAIYICMVITNFLCT